MFNTYRGGDTNIKVNAVSGTIVKNFAKSFFLSFSIGSCTEKNCLTKTQDLQEIIMMNAQL